MHAGTEAKDHRATLLDDTGAGSAARRLRLRYDALTDFESAVLSSGRWCLLGSV